MSDSQEAVETLSVILHLRGTKAQHAEAINAVEAALLRMDEPTAESEWDDLDMHMFGETMRRMDAYMDWYRTACAAYEEAPHLECWKHQTDEVRADLKKYVELYGSIPKPWSKPPRSSSS